MMSFQNTMPYLDAYNSVEILEFVWENRQKIIGLNVKIFTNIHTDKFQASKTYRLLKKLIK